MAPAVRRPLEAVRPAAPARRERHTVPRGQAAGAVGGDFVGAGLARPGRGKPRPYGISDWEERRTMKLLTFALDGKICWGAGKGSGVVDRRRRFGDRAPPVRA